MCPISKFRLGLGNLNFNESVVVRRSFHVLGKLAIGFKNLSNVFHCNHTQLVKFEILIHKKLSNIFTTNINNNNCDIKFKNLNGNQQQNRDSIVTST